MGIDRISLDTTGQVQQAPRIDPALLRAGSQYNALVVDKTGEQVELLIGNRTLFARTELELTAGQTLSLLLAETRPDLYLFRVIGREGATVGTLQVPIDADTILARLGYEANTQTRTVLASLMDAGIPVTPQTIALFLRFEGTGTDRLQLLTFVYTQFMNAGVSPDFALMTAISNYLASGPAIGPLAELLRKIKDRDRDERIRLLTDALVLGEGDLSAGDIKALAAFLFTPAESSIVQAILDYDDSGEEEEGGHALLTNGASLVLTELLNGTDFVDGESTTGVINSLLAQLEAVNLLNSLPQSDFLLELPVEIGGTTTSLFIKAHREPVAGYEDNVTVFMTLETERLGRIETFIRRSGRDLKIDMYMRDEDTLRIVEGFNAQSGLARNLSYVNDVSRVRLGVHRLAGEVAVIED